MTLGCVFQGDSKATMTLSAERLYPQHFRPYYFVVTNDDGESEQVIDVMAPPEGTDSGSGRPTGCTLLSLVLTVCAMMYGVTA